MEKYRKYTDTATGINPFVPGLRPTIIRYAAAVVLLPFMTVLSAIPFFCLLLANVLCIGLTIIKLGFVSRIIFPLFSVPCTVSLLFIWGQVAVITAPCPRRPSQFIPSGGSDDVAPLSAGQVVFTNLQSPLDVVVLQRVFYKAPLVFAFPVPLQPQAKDNVNIDSTTTSSSYATAVGAKASGNNGALASVAALGRGGRKSDAITTSPTRGRVSQRVALPGSSTTSTSSSGGSASQGVELITTSLFPSAMTIIIGGLTSGGRSSPGDPAVSGRSDGQGVVDLSDAQRFAAYCGAPLVFFAEGATTNGQGVLTFPPTRTVTLAKNAHPAVVGIAYQASAAHCAVLPQSFLGWQLRALAGSLSMSNVFVALARPSACPRGVDAPEELAAQAQSRVAQAVEFHKPTCKQMSVASAADKIKFMEQYKTYQK